MTFIFPEVVVYRDADYGGGDWRTNLTQVKYVGDSWNDCISSIVVVSGTWTFYADADFNAGEAGGGIQKTLGPGYYPWVEAEDIPNDTISSFQCISWDPQGDNPKGVKVVL